MKVKNEVWQEYRKKLFSFILNRVKNKMEAEDILHDVLLKAYSNINELKNEDKVTAWLYQITRNAIIDYYRENKPEVELEKVLSVFEKDENQNFMTGLTKCLIPLLNQIPPKYREAVKLSELDGFTQKEVAQRQGVSLSGAKSRVQRGRKMLREAFIKCCEIELNSKGKLVNFEQPQYCKNC